MQYRLLTPPPVLPFPVPENYIPTTPSTMKNLEDAVVRAVGMMPHLVQELSSAITRTHVPITPSRSDGSRRLKSAGPW